MDAPTQHEQALDLIPGSRGKGKQTRGRKDSSGAEETVNVTGLKTAAPVLLRRLRKASTLMAEVRDDVSKICEANGANSAQFMRLLKASLKGNYQDQRRKCEQQAIIFDAVGEVSDAHVTTD